MPTFGDDMVSDDPNIPQNRLPWMTQNMEERKRARLMNLILGLMGMEGMTVPMKGEEKPPIVTNI